MGKKNKKYYDSLSYDELCNCQECKLFYSKARQEYPEIADWLAQLGIDIGKTFEGDYFVLEIGPMQLEMC